MSTETPGAAPWDADLKLGLACRRNGDLAGAIAAWRRVLAVEPEHGEALRLIGDALLESGHADTAVTAYRLARRIAPGQAATRNNFGVALKETGDRAGAMQAWREALRLDPGYADAHYNLGLAFHEDADLPAAIESYLRAIERDPAHAKAFNNLGWARHESGDLDGAIAAYRRALEVEPGYADAGYNLALALLLAGDLPAAWPWFELRYHPARTGRQRVTAPALPFPMWQGGPLPGKKLLIVPEQGFGDQIQFCRYGPRLAGLGAKVALLAPPPLFELFRTLPDIDVLALDQIIPADIDYWTFPLSLPGRLDPLPGGRPAQVPYLAAAEEKINRWRNRLAAHPQRLRVGIAWAGSPGHSNDRNRSLAPELLGPLWQLPDVLWVNLQRDARADGIPASFGAAILDAGCELGDFSDTAALLSAVDLVISVDTAVAHLAGALARPVWTLLPFVPDWRWQRGSSTTAWYRSMELFRQPRAGEWAPVLDHVAERLRAGMRSSATGREARA